MADDQMGRSRYEGYVLSWEPKYNFGKLIPAPWKKVYHCWSWSEQEARDTLARMAQKDGYGLGGVQNVHCTMRGSGGNYPKAFVRPAETSKVDELEKQLAELKAMLAKLTDK